MLLYNVYYPGRAMDRAVPLGSHPTKDEHGAVACCVNGDQRTRYKGTPGGWLPIDAAEAQRLITANGRV